MSVRDYANACARGLAGFVHHAQRPTPLRAESRRDRDADATPESDPQDVATAGMLFDACREHPEAVAAPVRSATPGPPPSPVAPPELLDVGGDVHGLANQARQALDNRIVIQIRHRQIVARWCAGRMEPRLGLGQRSGMPPELVSANLEHDLATLPAARDSLGRRPGLRERK
jgi:hypothetical protein